MKSVLTMGRIISQSRRIVAPLVLLSLLAGVPIFLAVPSPSAGDEDKAATNVDWPSPDGRFAFVTSLGEDRRTIDLVDKKSGKKLQRIGDGDSGQAYWHVLWAPDSKWFALMTRLGHPIQGVDVFVRGGESFRKVELPALPEANIPEELKHGKRYPHFANMNWQEAEEWRKDGSLVVTVVTMVDGDAGSITATRTLVIAFDRAGKPKILQSTIKYETADD
jgi:hypothetical protein